MMAKKVKVLSPLLSELFPRLAEQGFGESDVDSVGGILVARVQATYVERLMIDVESIPDRQGEWSFRVMCGVEFHDLERNGWVGIPETHSPSLVMKCFSCRPSTDWGELSEELSEWIAAAFMTIANDSESIRQAYFRLIENRTGNTCQRLSLLSSKYEEEGNSPVPWNAFQLCSGMLTAKEPRFEVLKRVEPTAVTDEVISSLLGKMANLMRLLHMPLGKHVEGQCDHQAIPHRGIVRYAFWPLLPRKLYIAVAQDGPSAPLELILGASDFSFVRPVPQIAKLVIPAETSKAKKSVTKMSFDAVSRAVKLLTKSEPAFVTLRFVEFEDDGDAHDEGLIDDRHTEFAASFRMAVESLSRKFGPPARRERGELEVIPIGGVMEYSLWEVEGRGMYVAWCHEDRELPIMLVLGTLPEKQ